MNSSSLDATTEEDESRPIEIRNDLTVELMKHLSMEVQLASQQLVAQRSKNNLLVAFGPYLVLGLLATNSSFLIALGRLPERWFLLGVGGYFCLYVGLGWLAAQIEAKFWNQANYWRRQIALLSGTSPSSVLFDSRALHFVYVVIYGVSAAVLVAVLALIYYGVPR